ncbi:MAG: ornithine--oxo-acid transaminase [Alphaproteobacteria bacterium]|nr:ornithine--oxo-acid transaminase [Alphaproteobacteria bacterium]
MNTTIDKENRYCAHNYHPLPVVIARGEGVWLWDDAGNKYLDMMSAYSAVSHGHSHPRMVKALTAQASRLCIASRAFYSDTLAPFLEKLCSVTGMDVALPMNTGAEAVETALKAARRWGYNVKGIPAGKAEIIVSRGNFHGRTTTIISFSSDEEYKQGFGPFTPGFKDVPFGDITALEAAITPNTCAFLTEPIQGEAGIVLPPEGWLKQVQALCRKHNVLLITDEIQSGLGRTGKLFAFQHEIDRPDALILGKALGGGMMPVSAFLARKDVMDQFTPGSHGSTFGGNPLGAAVGLEALRVLEEEKLTERSAELGAYLKDRLRGLNSPLVSEVRGKGLWIGMEIDPAKAAARTVCEKLMARGVLSKETHHTVVRFAPPLIITKEQIDSAVNAVREVLSELAEVKKRA